MSHAILIVQKMVFSKMKNLMGTLQNGAMQSSHEGLFKNCMSQNIVVAICK
jgi:hypothetical protein